MRWRAMTPDDIPAVANLAIAVHADYPENASVFAACARLYPAGCHVLAQEDGAIAGYLISHPGRLETPSVLDVPLAALPEPQDCYYLHDLALGAAARGRGFAAAAIEIVIGEARRGAFDVVALIAVGDAHDFWARQGFAPLGDGLLDSAKGYGAEARALIRRI